MKLLRITFVRRTIAVFLLLVFVQSIFLANYSWALTTGPHQPEYTSYEEPGSTDMVNLLTGDFTYSLPVLDVPGPEGGFSMPLTYNAGIGLEQEASWVGLGWTMNAGAITRNINEYPDDANGEGHSVSVKDLVGLRGWDATPFGIGKFGWNNQVGHFGHLSLMGIVNADWSEGSTSVGIAGINVTNDGLKGDPIQGIMAITSLMFLVSAPAVVAGTKTLLKEAAQQVAISAVMDAGMSMATGTGKSPSAPSAGYWKYSKKGFDIGVFKKYRIWLDKTRYENMYGSLYLGNVPTDAYVNAGLNVGLSLNTNGSGMALSKFPRTSGTTNRGSASDINYMPDINEEMKEFYEINNPVVLASDNFSVKAAGISGSISPYRLEVGSVAMPREMSDKHDRLAPVQFISNNPATAGNYKVPFVYDGMLSNSYFHHVGGATSPTTPSFYFGVSTSTNTPPPTINKTLTYNLNDATFGATQRVSTAVATNKKIAQANHTEWLTNEEIRTSTVFPSKFMDFLSGADRVAFRTNIAVGAVLAYGSTTSFSTTIPVATTGLVTGDYVELNCVFYDNAQQQLDGTPSSIQQFPLVQVTVPGASSFVVNSAGLTSYFGKIADISVRIINGSMATQQAAHSIGGFCITSADGKTYHFALPIYEFDNYSMIREVANPSTKFSTIQRSAPFANTWLLTGITGPDFVDRNSNGMIDEADWGYWVKLNYGRHLNDYSWRSPLTGFQLMPGATHENYSSGKNQLLYLNSIETRSHVALFMKSQRADGRSASNTSYFPLRLDEIALVSKENYNKLIAPVPQGGCGMTNFSNQVTSVLMGSTVPTCATTLIKENCLKRVKFNYDYTLCQSTPNSMATPKGKLTLASVSVLGRNDLKAIPDYKFFYGNNPSYSINHWDAWGMYNPAGATSGYREATENDIDGSAWSLTKVLTPLGSEMTINYERDVYASVSGNKVLGGGVNFDNSGLRQYYPSHLPIRKLYITHNGFFQPGDEVRIIGGYANYTCGNLSPASKAFSGDYTIVGVGTDQANINGVNESRQYIDLGTDYMELGTCSLVNSGDYIQFSSQAGGITKILPSKRGGNIRVGSVVSTDNYGPPKKIRYLYNKSDGTSSGVVSDIPPYLLGGPYFDMPGYPQTPVMYGTVSVLMGGLSTDTDFYSKQVYEFETPHFSQYTVSKSIVAKDALISSFYDTPSGFTYTDYLNVFENKISDMTSRIGRPKSIKVYDKTNTLVSSSDMQYTDQVLNNQILNTGNVNKYQGVYSSGLLMFDRVNKGNNSVSKTHKLNRTTVLQYPYALKKVINTKGAFTSESQNLVWDFYSGVVLEKLEKTSLGMYLKSVTRPAYTITPYANMGPKGSDLAKRNMLSQQAATYVYQSDANANTLGLISANAQTWSKEWSNYRDYSSGTQTFANTNEAIEANKVWRISGQYFFKGNYAKRQSNGTLQFNLADDFDFVNLTTGQLWQYVVEPRRFDHYGMPLETYDVMSATVASSKMGYSDRMKIASASNASYLEIAFSGAEDLQSDKPFFGGEVGLGSGSVLYKSKGQATETHTGDAVVSLTSGYSFVYKSSGIISNKKYRACTWTNSTNGRIYYKLNGGSEVLSAAPDPLKKVGNWYLIDIDIPAGPTTTSIEVGVTSASGQVLFDDFRFQPKDAVMVCYVYNPLDFIHTVIANVPTLEYSYVLNNDNLFTKYEHTERGLLKRTSQESFKYGVKLVSETNDNYRRFNTNQ